METDAVGGIEEACAVGRVLSTLRCVPHHASFYEWQEHVECAQMQEWRLTKQGWLHNLCILVWRKVRG